VVEVPTAPLVEELLLDGSHSDQLEEVEELLWELAVEGSHADQDVVLVEELLEELVVEGSHADQVELVLELVLVLELEELEEVDVLVYGSSAQDEVVVAVAAAARPETRIAEARILNYFALQKMIQWLVGSGRGRIKDCANWTANVVEMNSKEWTTEVKRNGTRDETWVLEKMFWEARAIAWPLVFEWEINRWSICHRAMTSRNE
jgi:hypothetical protein